MKTFNFFFNNILYHAEVPEEFRYVQPCGSFNGIAGVNAWKSIKSVGNKSEAIFFEAQKMGDVDSDYELKEEQPF